MKKIMFSGSRASSKEAIEKARILARKYIPQASIVLVGDAPGVDEEVIKVAAQLGMAHKLVVKAPGKKPRVWVPREAKLVILAGKGYSFRERAYSRDRESIEEADLIVVVRTNKSGGASSVIEYARSLGKKIEVYDFDL